MKQHWKERFNAGGICDFKKNYDFYFKWLLNKTCSCFYIKGLPETINEFYLKSNLIIDGDIAITDFTDKLYACIGAPSGQPDEYYIPTQYTIANPVLGSKVITRGEDGVVIYNSDLDQYIPGGLFGLIDQTATLLADNIISINCNQINTRVAAIFTADSEAQAIAGEVVLKKMYTGAPYQIIRSDLIDKINVNPIASTATSQNITELVELNNYIIANYFQSIGIKSNDIRKRAHVLQDEIDSQEDYLQISILEIMTSWQRGFDEVNKLYNTDIHVELNPALVPELIHETTTADETDSDNKPELDTEDVVEDITSQVEAEPEDNTETEPVEVEEAKPEVEADTSEDMSNILDENEKAVEAIVDHIISNTEEEEVQEDVTTEEVIDSE